MNNELNLVSGKCGECGKVIYAVDERQLSNNMRMHKLRHELKELKTDKKASNKRDAQKIKAS